MVIVDYNEHVFWLELLIIPKLWNVTKAVFGSKHDRSLNSCFVQKCKTVHCYENGAGFCKKINNLPQATVLILE